MSVCAIYGEGAPSLRFLQGRVTMLPTQLLWLCNPVTHAFQISARCKVRKRTGHPLCFFCASEVKNLGYPPAALSVESPTLQKMKRGPPACSLTHSSPLRFESPLFQVQGDLRLLLTFTYHGCPRIPVPQQTLVHMRVRRVSGRFVVDRDCAKTGLLLPFGGRGADWFAIGQC